MNECIRVRMWHNGNRRVWDELKSSTMHCVEKRKQTESTLIKRKWNSSILKLINKDKNTNFYKDSKKLNSAINLILHVLLVGTQCIESSYLYELFCNATMWAIFFQFNFFFYLLFKTFNFDMLVFGSMTKTFDELIQSCNFLLQFLCLIISFSEMVWVTFQSRVKVCNGYLHP